MIAYGNNFQLHKNNLLILNVLCMWLGYQLQQHIMANGSLYFEQCLPNYLSSHYL